MIKPNVIQFENLLRQDKGISNFIGNLFSRKGSGFVIVKNIPNYTHLRREILQSGFELMTGPKNKLDILRSNSSKYYVRYSDTPFVTDDGQKHIMQTSFVARPTSDTLKSSIYPDFEKGIKTNGLIKNLKRNSITLAN